MQTDSTSNQENKMRKGETEKQRGKLQYLIYKSPAHLRPRQ